VGRTTTSMSAPEVWRDGSSMVDGSTMPLGCLDAFVTLVASYDELNHSQG
jgi:hypothetical protein